MVESGDSESIVSPVRQIQLELPSPINTFFVNGAPAPNPLTDSALKQEVRAILGAAAGTDVVIFTFAKGLWKIYAWFQAQFTGTTNVGVNSGLNFRDPDGNEGNILRMDHITGSFLAESLEIPILFQRDGFTLLLNQGATVALDTLGVSATVLACREL